MKAVKFIVAALAVLAVSTSAFAASDKEKDTSNRDENGKIVRGPYETNGFGDNWFIGAAGGINLFGNSANGFKARITPALDFDFGKWITPGFGLRVGYQGLTGSENSSAVALDPNATTYEKFGFAYVHGDAMWNISNTIGGYRSDRFWSFVPYVHVGVLAIYGLEDGANEGKWLAVTSNEADRELAGGFGLLNQLHLSKRLNLTLDVRQLLFSPRFHDNNSGHPASNMCATLGLQVLLGQTGWNRCADSEKALAASASALADAESALAAAKEAQKAAEDAKKNDEDKIAALMAANDALSQEVDRLNAKVDSLENAVKEASKVYINEAERTILKLGTAPCTVFFEKNSHRLNDTEAQHLRFYIENILAQDPDHCFEITGCTDSATGTPEFNEALGKKRAKEIVDFVTKNYNVDKSRLIVKGTENSSAFTDPRFNRSVILEH